ncbi:MAG: type II toxin-antitoxin system HicA family toxin [Thiobacillus sp.]|nr:type II toxin-antitoxin system HicA family toxin [Thiobacillus sp.]
MSKKQKLIDRLQKAPPPTDFTWDEAVRLMEMCGFKLINNTGSRRKFVHTTGVRAFLHEPHPESVIKRYTINDLLDALRTVGEIK